MRSSRAPAILGSILLHAAVVAFALMHWAGKPMQLGSAVPVTIVTHMEAQAPVLAPEPTPPEAPPAPAPETDVAPPPPAKAEPRTEPQPKPVATRPAEKPAQKPPKPTQAAPRDVDADFARSMSMFEQKPGKANPAKAKPSAQARAAAAPKVALTPAQQSAALAGLADKLGQLWRIDCNAAGSRSLVARVKFQVRSDGRLDGEPVLVGDNGSAPLAATAARQLVKAQAPYSLSDIPMPLRNEEIIVNFRGEHVCAQR